MKRLLTARIKDCCCAIAGTDSPCPVLCTGGGTPHKPPILDANGYVYFESNNMADYLTNKVGRLT